MIELLRTDSSHPGFVELVRLLDAHLVIVDGDEHPFYDQYNKLDSIRHVVLAIENEKAIACGAIKAFDDTCAEVKRMYTLESERGRGLAGKVLTELEEWAAELGFQTCILETGKKQEDAIRLYRKMGYSPMENYGQYSGVENSLCFSKDLEVVYLNDDPGTDPFVEFQRVQDIESAVDLTDLLEENELEFLVDDTALRFSTVSVALSFVNPVVVMVRQSELVKANALISQDSERDVEHYLYSFSDEDIVNVIRHPEEWTTEEQSIAMKIIEQRKLSLVEEKVDEGVLESSIEVGSEPIKSATLKELFRGSGKFLMLNLLAWINWALESGLQIKLFFGFGVGRIFDRNTSFVPAENNGYNMILIGLLGAAFVWLWLQTRLFNSWSYTAGLILYVLDLLIALQAGDYYSTGFHVLFLVYLGFGYYQWKAELNERNELLGNQMM